MESATCIDHTEKLDIKSCALVRNIDERRVGRILTHVHRRRPEFFHRRMCFEKDVLADVRVVKIYFFAVLGTIMDDGPRGHPAGRSVIAMDNCTFFSGKM